MYYTVKILLELLAVAIFGPLGWILLSWGVGDILAMGGAMSILLAIARGAVGVLGMGAAIAAIYFIVQDVCEIIDEARRYH